MSRGTAGWRAAATVWGSVCLLLGCGSDGSAPDGPTPPPGTVYHVSEPQVLSAGSPTKDEDPSVLRARDGSMYVAWFSDRGGNPDIYVTRTTDGTSWAAPVRVTTAPGGDFNPSLLQDSAGVFHLVWFRWEALFRGSIWYNRSADGLAWDAATEVPVTTEANVDDWVPTLAEAPDGTLFVYFVSDARDPSNPTNEIYVAWRRPSEAAWSAAVRVGGVNSATLHDHLPFAARVGTSLGLVWVRHDRTEPLPWLNKSSQVLYATSADGLSFSAPVAVTSDPPGVVNLFPALYASQAGAWSVLWLSTRTGAPKLFEVGASDAGGSPSAVGLPDGYSHKIAATPTLGVYLAAWVAGPDGAQDVFYRFFER